jgi:hypothetical protein
VADKLDEVASLPEWIRPTPTHSAMAEASAAPALLGTESTQLPGRSGRLGMRPTRRVRDTPPAGSFPTTFSE